MRYLIVVHLWFVASIAWKYKVVEVASKEEAEKEAILFESQFRKDMQRSAYFVVPLSAGDGVTEESPLWTPSAVVLVGAIVYALSLLGLFLFW